MGRATQGVRLINLTKKNDVIASVCKVMSSELEATVEEESRAQWAQKSESIRKDTLADTPSTLPDEELADEELTDEELVDEELNEEELVDDNFADEEPLDEEENEI